MLKIYMCVFFSQDYVKEAKLCIESLRTHGKYAGEIYLFTDLEDIKIEGVTIIKADCDSIANSSAFRLDVFNYIEFKEDDIVLYLDTDIMILKPLPDFSWIDDKVNVYGYNGTFGYRKRKQKEESFAGYLTTDREIVEQDAFCAGILLFRPTEYIRKLFADTLSLHRQNVKVGKINNCWEQPSLCFILAKNHMFSLNLNAFVHEERMNANVKDSVIFNHFCGMRGHQRNVQMRKYL